FADDVSRTVIGNGVYRIEPQRIRMEVADPLKRHARHELPDRPALLAVVVDSIPPRATMAWAEIRAKFAKVIPLGLEVVVDEVQTNGAPPPLRIFTQPLTLHLSLAPFIHT